MQLCNVVLFMFCLFFSIDPYQGKADSGITWGATINHSRQNANIKPFVADKNSKTPRVFFVALHDIPETVELLWDYNDREWSLYSNSQTLPE